MRITKIEIKNFKAFRGPDVIDLSDIGQNLLIYGENGSGKTSLYRALKFCLESSEGIHRFGVHKNTFFSTEEGYVKLHFTPDKKLNKGIYEWSEASPNDAKPQLIIDASKAKGFLGYRDLLKTNYLHRNEKTIDVFDLLINTLLANIINDLTDPPRSFAEQWKYISNFFSSGQVETQEIVVLKEQLQIFNAGLKDKLDELETLASEILHMFRYEDTVVALKFVPSPVTYNQDSGELNDARIPLKVDFFGDNRPDYHEFFNEAKLSAIALSIFFAGFKLQPPSDLKVLALDDALIGLDMSNRLPVLDILLDEKYFANYQILLTTYDREWYEIVKQRVDSKEWKYVEFYCGDIDGREIPVYKEDKSYLEVARKYFDENDYKACAVYLRTAFEEIIRRFCDKRKLRIEYCENPADLKIRYFWKPIKSEKKKCTVFKNDEILLVCPKIVDVIEMAQKFMLNDLCHATLVNIHKDELKDAMKAVGRLEAALA